MKKYDPWNAEHTCHECNVKMKRKKLKIEGMSVRGWECKKCGETVLHPEDAQKVLLLNRLKAGIPAKVGVSGGSMFVRFPKQIARYYHLKAGEIVNLKVKDRETLALKISAKA